MKVYIDDQRKAPEGWIQVFNSNDAIEFIMKHHVEITHIDFDYYLSETNNYDTGMKIIEYLISVQQSYDVDIFHEPVENYTFHSSDSYMNDLMKDKLLSFLTKDNRKAPIKMSKLQMLRKSKGSR